MTRTGIGTICESMDLSRRDKENSFRRDFSNCPKAVRTFGHRKVRGCCAVGNAIGTTPAVMAKDFVTKDGTLLKDAVLKQPNIFHTPDDPDNADYLVGVDWKKTFPLNEAKWLDGGFANQNIVCRLRHPATLDFLKKAFDVE